MLSEVSGIHPAKTYPGRTRNAYHLYMFRYDKQHFANMPREKFLKALAAEGIPEAAATTRSISSRSSNVSSRHAASSASSHRMN